MIDMVSVNLLGPDDQKVGSFKTIKRNSGVLLYYYE
jgi:hypothetical protein